jgi:hypothetical protein
MLVAKVYAGCNAGVSVIHAKVAIAGREYLSGPAAVHRKVALELGHQAAFPALWVSLPRGANVSDRSIFKFYPVAGHR